MKEYKLTVEFHNGARYCYYGKTKKEAYNSFCGYTLFGDPYLLGRRPVIRFITREGGKLVAAE